VKLFVKEIIIIFDKININNNNSISSYRRSSTMGFTSVYSTRRNDPRRNDPRQNERDKTTRDEITRDEMTDDEITQSHKKRC
jgi:hypothetical protein